MCLLQLTLPQRRLLIWLYEHAGDCSNQAVGIAIGGKAADSQAMTRVFISKIRHKLLGSGWTISHNNRGRGYHVVPDGE